MGYKVLISNRAEEQLSAIIEYVAERLCNPTAAKAILDDIESAFNTLETIPEAFAVCEDPYLSSKGYRKVVLKEHNYVLIYRLQDDIVQVSGIFHFRENYIEKL